MGLRELKFIVEWERRSFAAAVIQHFVVVGGAMLPVCATLSQKNVVINVGPNWKSKCC